MKRIFLIAVAFIFVGSLCTPYVTYAKNKGQPAEQASEVAKEQAADKTDGAVKKNKHVVKKGKGKKGGAKAKHTKKHGTKKTGKKGATPATPAAPTPGTPGAPPAVPATPQDVNK